MSDYHTLGPGIGKIVNIRSCKDLSLAILMEKT